jgi:hypothetical protein
MSKIIGDDVSYALQKMEDSFKEAYRFSEALRLAIVGYQKESNDEEGTDALEQLARSVQYALSETINERHTLHDLIKGNGPPGTSV